MHFRFQPQRGCDLQPRVAAERLPWVGEHKYPTTPTGLRLAARVATPLGLVFQWSVYPV